MNKQSLKVYYVDSFTSKQFKGNPAGVVLHTDDLSVELMQKIAQEINLSETVFAKKANNYFVVRYFTRCQEIKFCGHATLALAWVLGKKYNYVEIVDKLKFLSNVGEIIINWEKKNNNLNKVFMKQVTPKIRQFTGNIGELCKILGLSVNDIDNKYPLKLAYTGNWDLFLPVKTSEIIKKINPDMKKLKIHNISFNVVSTHLFSFNNQIITRNFAPAVGIDEDLVTGSSTGALIGCLMLEKIISWDNHYLFIKQINSFNREGIIYVKSKVDNGLSIYVGGKAVCTLEGLINIR